jgi:hypothetical protein
MISSFGNDEDDLAMRDTQNRLLPHPFAPLLKPFGMAGGAESSRSTGEGQKEISATARTADAGEPAARVAAVQIALYDLLDDRTEEAVLLLEAALIISQEFEVHRIIMLPINSRGGLQKSP